MQARTPTNHSPRLRVFVLEPQPALRRGIEQFVLASTGIELCGASANLSAGLGSILVANPDVVVVGVSPNAEDCFAPVRVLRERCSRARLLVISSYSRVRVIQAAFAAGAHGFLHSDEAPEKLVEAIKAVASGRQYLTPAMARKIPAWVSLEQAPSEDRDNERLD